MKIMYEYVLFIQRCFEKPRNELEKRLIKHYNKNIEQLVHKYDLLLLEKYQYIEEFIEKELEEDNE